MTISINYGIGKYKGTWQPFTTYQQYDAIHNGQAVWVADVTFTSGATFDPVNLTCANCNNEVYPYTPDPEQGFDLLLGTGSKLHSYVGGDDEVIENSTGSDITDDAAWAVVSHPHSDLQLRYFEYEILTGGRVMCGYGVNSPTQWVGNTGTDASSYDIGDGLVRQKGILYKVDVIVSTGDVVRVWVRGGQVWFGSYSTLYGHRVLSGDPYLNYEPVSFNSSTGDYRPLVTCYGPSTSVKLNTVGDFTFPPLNNARPWDS